MAAAQCFDGAFLDALVARARINPRLRQHHSLHASPDEPAQRLFNAIEPASYVAAHRHAHPARNETLLVLAGSLGVIFFDDAGTPAATHRLSAGGAGGFGMELPAGPWHSVVALTAGTVIFEVKAGPYQPLDPRDVAPWAPAPGSPQAAAWVARMHSLFT
ncbi:MAG: WbuC family cupin fold metalloprotein [Candidatus Dactylopiibacterium sp.]|nr:WbuC family cupin fold metalloprotein [Candidatus Dactylopiibacterium sp.]